MGLKFGAVVLRVRNISRAAEFWRAALGYSSTPDNEAFLRPDNGEGPRIHLDEDDRTHLDLWTLESGDMDAEVERLVALGAERADWDYPDDADFVVLRDTEGNLFCVVSE